MKLIESRFHKPAHIVQVFRMANRYGKEEKSFADRKHKLVWREMSSTSGYVDNGLLYLPESVSTDKKFGNCALITIEDQCDLTPRGEWKLVNKRYEKGDNHCFNLHHPSGYETFAFFNDPPELWLQHSTSYFGEPSRPNQKLGRLPDANIEVKINVKFDNDNGRHYMEFQFVFLYLGQFKTCFLLPEKSTPVTKTVPESRKLINLLEPLW